MSKETHVPDSVDDAGCPFGWYGGFVTFTLPDESFLGVSFHSTHCDLAFSSAGIFSKIGFNIALLSLILFQDFIDGLPR